jgi:hypothetical protein
MKIVKPIVLSLVFLLPGLAVHAENGRDCMLEGTVLKDDQAANDSARIKIHSVSRYDGDSNCRVRRDEKLEFKLPADTRVQQAPDGSRVKYRYRTDGEGGSQAELISVGA